MRGSWVFGLITLLFLAFAFFWPEPITAAKAQILRVVAAAMAGLFGFFLGGTLSLQIGRDVPTLGRVATRGTGGFALFLLVFLLWPSPAAEVYRLRVTVRAPDGAITTDAEVTVRPAGEAQKTASGWIGEIPAALLSADRRVLVQASRAGARPAEQAVTLGEELNPSVELRLGEEPGAEVRGTVMDGESRPIAGATVSVHGYGDEAVITEATGTFRLPAHVSARESIQLQVTAPGYRPANPYVLAGSVGVTVQLLIAEGGS